jgi:hypothetical protein
LVSVLALAAPAMLAASACDAPKSYARCEQNQAVYYRGDDTEMSRTACAADEQCVKLPVEQAVCRLFETCQVSTVTSSECRGNDLIICNPEEQLRQRIDCVTHNHDKPIPGRCDPLARPRPDCVDEGALPCDYAFKPSCVGHDRLVCREGYTSIEAACSVDDRAFGGVCRLNTTNEPVCALPDAEACSQDDPWGHCEEGRITRCEGGFVWREACPAGQRCIDGVRGDVAEAYCE